MKDDRGHLDPMRDFLNPMHTDIELRRQAWHQASLEVDAEIWRGILQKCSNMVQGWRDCPRGPCRRQRCCRDDPQICLEVRRRTRSWRPLSPEEEVAVRADLRRQLDRHMARLDALGAVSDLPARTERLARRKLAALQSS